MLFGTVGVPISTSKNPGGSISGILKLRELGLDALELGWVQSVRISEAKCVEIRNSSSENRIKLSVHAPYYINLNANELEWPKSRKRLMDSAFFGNLAGATDVVFHPGSYFGYPPADVLKIIIPRLRDCLAELRSYQNPIILRPETMGKGAMLGSLEDTLEMSKQIEGVLPCLDFAHLHARPGDGSQNSKKEWELTLNIYAKTLGDDSLSNLHIHLSGIEYSSKGEKKHLPLKESDLDLESLFIVLSEFNCTGRILCESPILEQDAIFMRDLWSSVKKG
jgi:deoxyribonuclease-4